MPPYPQILKEKKKCRPNPEDVFLSESQVGASLQVMLDLTMRRLLQNPEIVAKLFEVQNNFENVRLEFIYKLGIETILKKSRGIQRFIILMIFL